VVLAVSVSMTCSKYSKNFPDLIDGNPLEEDLRAFEEHLRECPACSHHRYVLEQGSALLRTLPEPKLSENFLPRLWHRLYHVDNQRALRSSTFATMPVVVLAVAVILMAVSWLPIFRDATPEMALETVIVQQPSLQVMPERLLIQSTGSSSDLFLSPFTVSREQVLLNFRQGLWDDAHVLLFEYSPLSLRSQQRGVLRNAGFDEQR